MTTTGITCPSCGTVSYLEELNRDSTAFCRKCDFPLFWTRATRLAGDPDPAGDTGVRRLPGTAGRIAIATFDCPVCTEPNPVNASICIRCGSLLHPPPPEPIPEPPPPPVVYEPPPPPPPPPPKRVIWPWVALGVLFLIGLTVLIVLLAT